MARFNLRLAQALGQLCSLTVFVTGVPEVVPGIDIVVVGEASRRMERYYRDPLRLRSALGCRRLPWLLSSGDDWALGRRVDVRILHGTARSEARSSRGLRRLNHHGLAALERRSLRLADRTFTVGPDVPPGMEVHGFFPPVAGISVPTSVPPLAHRAGSVFIGPPHGRKRGLLAWEMVVAIPELAPLTVVGHESDRAAWPADVRFISGPSDEDVGTLLRGARFLLSPSTYEGFGIPVFEALANGTVPLVSDNPGSRLLLSDDPLSRLVGPSDPRALVRHVRDLLGSILADQEAIQRAARHRASELEALADPAVLLPPATRPAASRPPPMR